MPLATLARRSSLVLSLAAGVLAGASVTAHAADATPEEAQRLTRLLESGLGGSTNPAEPRVTVTPKGEAYEVVVDLSLVTAPLTAAGISLSTKSFVFTLTPRADGSWKRVDGPLPSISGAIGDQTFEAHAEGFEGEGVFDPAIAAFSENRAKIARLTASSTVPATGDRPRIDVEKTEADYVLDTRVGPGAGGEGVDLALVQTTGAITHTYAISEGSAQSIPDMSVVLRFASSRTVADITGVRWRPILDLWTHLVAHHDKTDFTEGQTTLKPLLSALLPGFQTWRQTSRFDGFALESPFAFASARQMALAIDSTGASADGAFRFTLDLSGFQAQSIFMPKWVRPLVPSDLTLGGRVSGWNAAEPIADWLAAADFAATPPISDEASARIAKEFLPKGRVDIDLDGNHIRAGTWDVTLDGHVTAGPDLAMADLTIRAKGLDDVAGALRQSPEAGVAEITAALDTARRFAKTSDGEFVWHVEIDGKSVRINGKPLEKPTPPAGEEKPKKGARKKT